MDTHRGAPRAGGNYEFRHDSYYYGMRTGIVHAPSGAVELGALESGEGGSDGEYRRIGEEIWLLLDLFLIPGMIRFIEGRSFSQTASGRSPHFFFLVSTVIPPGHKVSHDSIFYQSHPAIAICF